MRKLLLENSIFTIMQSDVFIFVTTQVVYLKDKILLLWIKWRRRRRKRRTLIPPIYVRKPDRMKKLTYLICLLCFKIRVGGTSVLQLIEEYRYLTPFIFFTGTWFHLVLFVLHLKYVMIAMVISTLKVIVLNSTRVASGKTIWDFV